ncbi:MAG: Co2+/Mg2+ efflux protein ApaG [Gammaproteobacteria bacterium]|nr:Co2+/Mg2+ efflux protein ApaG [Gammaproteobacteria bacterium]MBK8133474.1 Co2+/Mg2+ efflux protein ApaG [Gammaproteobacteria bacterium]MBK9426279.1 Co2+/Mg2+ efflux protein ApaG [Gammaproteobacteria bacterium]
MNSSDIHIAVRTRYLPEQSKPAVRQFAFAYEITIANVGTEPAQLIARHWIIVDAHDKTQEVRGAGVVGEQPWIEPGQSFRYTSGVVLSTEHGTMTGSYRLRDSTGVELDAVIPLFVLAVPGTMH